MEIENWLGRTVTIKIGSKEFTGTVFSQVADLLCVDIGTHLASRTIDSPVVLTVRKKPNTQEN